MEAASIMGWQARTIRSNWLSDASYPSNHVRNNALIASYLYPSSYNGAWIVSEDDDLKRYANDPAMLDTIFPEPHDEPLRFRYDQRTVEGAGLTLS